MGLFKQAEIKKLIGMVSEGQISFGRMVELMNEKVYKDKAQKGELVTYMDIIRLIEVYLVQNDGKVKHEITSRLRVAKNQLMGVVLEGCMENLNEKK